VKKLYLFFAFFSLFIAHCSLLFASGKKDSDELKYLNDEWVLCVTAFDQSLLTPGRQLAGNVLTRELVDKLYSVSYRLRISPEYAYYESYAWQQEVGTAAKALSNKHNERSQMLYRGDPDWRYRQNIKKIDSDLEKLAADRAEKEAQRPLIHTEPSFKLTPGNLSGTYPAPPESGGERRFCQNQKADAFLTGTIREFHSRYYIQLRLFTLYTNSWAYEDEIIFSLEDSGGAVEEIAARLTAALAGSKPAAVAVTADPPESQILINRNYAGRGTVPARDHPPGNVIIAAAAEGFTPMTVEEKLVAGELSEVAVTLSPLQYADVHIDTADKAGRSVGGSVYHGALYVGEAPLTLRLPLDQLEYISIERQNERGKGVFTTPDLPSNPLSLSLKIKIPPPSGQQRVNKARRWYYWAWGGTWITGITAWVTYGMYSSQSSVLSANATDDFRSSTRRLNYISTGAIIAVGVAVGYEIFQMARYMYTATEDVTPIIKGDRRKK
jgi:hypothetical protein